MNPDLILPRGYGESRHGATSHNEENGFAVLKMKARGQRDLVVVVSHAASTSAGEFIHAVGVWFTDRILVLCLMQRRSASGSRWRSW